MTRPDFQNQLVCGGAGDAAVLPGVAELFAETRRSGLHGIDQRGTPPQPRHEGPHRQGGKRSRIHPQQDEGRRCPAGKNVKNKSLCVKLRLFSHRLCGETEFPKLCVNP